MKRLISAAIAAALTVLLCFGNVFPVFAAIVSITMPAEYAGMESQAEVDAAVAEEGFHSGTLNADGSVTYLMTEEKRGEMVTKLKAEMDESFHEITSEPLYGITEIFHSDDYQVFDAVTTANSESELSYFSNITLFVFSAAGGMYNAFTGNPAAPVTVNFKSPAGNIIKTWSSAEQGSPEDMFNSLIEGVADAGKAEDEAVTAQLSTRQFIRKNGPDTWVVFLEVTNNSDKTVSVETKVRAKDAAGNVIEESSNMDRAIAPGRNTAIQHTFFDCMADSFDCEVEGSVEHYLESAMPDLFASAEDLGNGVRIYLTNESETAADFPEVVVLFFAGDTFVGHSSAYFVDNDYQMKPHAQMNQVLRYWDSDTRPYDNMKIYIKGRRAQ